MIYKKRLDAFCFYRFYIRFWFYFTCSYAWQNKWICYFLIQRYWFLFFIHFLNLFTVDYFYIFILTPIALAHSTRFYFWTTIINKFYRADVFYLWKILIIQIIDLLIERIWTSWYLQVDFMNTRSEKVIRLNMKKKKMIFYLIPLWIYWKKKKSQNSTIERRYIITINIDAFR